MVRKPGSTSPDTDGAGGLPAPERITTYDIMSRVLTETDPLGNVTQHQYDGLDRLVSTTSPFKVEMGSLRRVR